MRPFRTSSLVGWVGSTILYALVAMLIIALAQRQTLAIKNRIRERFWPTFGWGLLGAVVVVPVVTVLLIISIVGILALLPWALVVFATFLFGAVGAAVLVGDLVLPWLGSKNESLLLAGVVGVLIVRLVGLIPVAGAIAVGVLWIVGFGAAFMAFWDWRREKRERGEGRADEADTPGGSRVGGLVARVDARWAGPRVGDGPRRRAARPVALAGPRPPHPITPASRGTESSRDLMTS